ncbi:MAG: hypothetical protein JRI23_01025 [Deltaproteobacteria bacterium]|jgi:hypothetical protein|nr:hypothetical protein [Deltaproteobacteria bacterium]MBW2530036.1 hypothetical protein [Deltaproteobacteria bacterium]
MKVSLHVEQPGEVKWHTTTEQFARIPAVGEYVAKTTSAAQEWFEVVIVVHIPVDEPGDFDAEVYARRVDLDAEIARMSGR